jgi:hypothetical protein
VRALIETTISMKTDANTEASTLPAERTVGSLSEGRR